MLGASLPAFWAQAKSALDEIGGRDEACKAKEATMIRMFAVLAVLAVLTLAAPAQAAPKEPPVLRFSGVLPCADCPGIRTTLTLKRKGPGWAEGAYRLSETYIDRGPPRVTTGDWTTLRGDAADEDATVYELDSDHPERARHFLRIGPDRALKALDRELKPWPKGLPDTLKRVR